MRSVLPVPILLIVSHALSLTKHNVQLVPMGSVLPPIKLVFKDAQITVCHVKTQQSAQSVWKVTQPIQMESVSSVFQAVDNVLVRNKLCV